MMTMMMMMMITHFLSATSYILSASKWLLMLGMSHFFRVLIVGCSIEMGVESYYQHCNNSYDADDELRRNIITPT